ncbi:MAG: cadherin-like beta sandwich domain-containing protein [Bacilli bacterium]|nr:cadherin-like beta sandwich domain-containing protein [Bacilli bacterium]
MKKYFNLFILFIGTIFLMIPSVLAAPKINSVRHIESDLYYVSADANGGTISAYIVGTSQSNAISFLTSSSETYITVPNGTYNIWVKDTKGNYSDAWKLYVTDSCSITYANDKTDTGHYERCYVKYSSGQEVAAVSASGATCATGYNMDAAYSTLSYNDCGNKNPASVGLEFRYCKKQYAYKCVKIQSQNPSGGSNNNNSGSGNKQDASTSNAKLSTLSISTGNIAPSFSSSTYNYSASTTSDSVTINASLMSNSASFVDGYGPRTVNLNYGTNNVQIRTKDGNSTNTYTIKITRKDSRSSTNTLSTLNISNGTLDPAFNSLTNNYTVKVDKDVESVDITATLSDSKSSFVDGYGPRTIQINAGYTRAAIKVKSESGSVRTYSILFGKDGGDVDLEETDFAELESLELSDGTIDFDSKTFDYNVSVGYEVTNIRVTAKSKHETDEVVVTGGENLELDKLNEITVDVKSEDGKYTNKYTIYVTRKEEDLPVSSNSLLQDLSIEGYKIKFDAKNTEYDVSVKEGVSELKINATPSDEKSTITIEGNENLSNGSKIKIRVTAENGTYTDYFIEVKQVGKGGNVFLTVLVILLIIIVMAYLVLRAMGYKIYFNLGAIKEQIAGLFKRK